VYEERKKERQAEKRDLSPTLSKVFEQRKVQSQQPGRHSSRVLLDDDRHSEPDNFYSDIVKKTFDDGKELAGGPEFYYRRNGVLGWRRMSFDAGLDSDVEEYVGLH
jgi:hypothetical protein